MGWRAWVHATADELSRIGLRDQASSLRSCGQYVARRFCEVHGLASCELTASCCSRVCPWCARRQAKERVRTITGAADRVPGYVAARRAAVIAEQTQLAADHARAVAHWSQLAARARDPAVADRHRQRARAAERRRSIASRALYALRDLSTWSWKMITVSPPWEPTRASELSPEGLRARVDDVLARVTDLWRDGLSVGGLGSATIRVELSSKGHVHAHVLYYGPWLVQSWAARVAGCVVDVRRAKDFGGGNDPRAAVREAVKYATKSPSPTRHEWIAGERWRVMHPELAAAWTSGTRHQQLLRHRGVIRDAISAEELAAAVDAPATQPHCCTHKGLGGYACGRELGPAQLVRTSELARELGARWRDLVSIVSSKG